MALRDPAKAQAISATGEKVPPITMTADNRKKSAEEKESREELLLAGEGGVLDEPSSVQYSKHQRLIDREAKEVIKMTNKAKANELMKLVNIKGSTRAKSTINHHQKEHELFLLYL